MVFFFLLPPQILERSSGYSVCYKADGLPGVDEGSIHLHLAEVGITCEVAVQDVNIRLVGSYLIQGGLEAGLSIAHSPGADGPVDDGAGGEVIVLDGVVVQLSAGKGALCDAVHREGPGGDLGGIEVLDVGVCDLQDAVFNAAAADIPGGSVHRAVYREPLIVHVHHLSGIRVQAEAVGVQIPPEAGGVAPGAADLGGDLRRLDIELRLHVLELPGKDPVGGGLVGVLMVQLLVLRGAGIRGEKTVEGAV